MSRSVQSVKNSLKFKATERDGILSVRIGTRKFAVPLAARMIAGGDYLFLSFPASAEMYRIEAGQLVLMKPEEDATAAFEALNPPKSTARRRSGSVGLPAEVAEALRVIPEGYRVGYGPDGTPKLIRKRRRTPKPKS